MNLSDRVWKYTNAFKQEIELGLDCGIRSGKDAPAMARELKQYLQHPDKLFRRVRDEHGLLQLSQAAADFHPGQGVYRSSYKNARRLAATETNIAYRTSDHLRWQQMDFVVGIEIQLSNNHTILLQPGEKTADKSQQRADGSPKANAVRPLTDICDELTGRYPKDFKFTGWHPHCRCRAITILKTEEEMAKDNEAILNGEEVSTQSENTVSDLPDNFKSYIQERSRIILNLDEAHTPYYIRDNQPQIGRLLANSQQMPTAPELIADVALEKALGIKQGPPMSFEEANHMRPNPNYMERVENRLNCASTALAYELRRQGYDVEAYGYIGKSCYMPHELSKRPEIAFLTSEGNHPTALHISYNKKSVVSSLNSEMREPGRYHLRYRFKDGNGHIVAVERSTDGSLKFYDTQSGKIIKDFDAYTHRINHSTLEYYRVDNLRVNPEVAKGAVKLSGSVGEAPKMSLKVESLLGKGYYGDDVAIKNNGISYLISDYYAAQGNKAKVTILKQITQDKSFKALRYHSTKDNTIFGVNMGAFDKELQQKELPKNLALAKKLVANKMDVYLLPNSSTCKSADFVVSRNGKLYYLEGKTLNGRNSLNHLLSDGATQSERICVDIIGNNNTKYVAENIEKIFQNTSTLKEVMLLKGSRLITINAAQAQSPNFSAWFKRWWERGR